MGLPGRLWAVAVAALAAPSRAVAVGDLEAIGDLVAYYALDGDGADGSGNGFGCTVTGATATTGHDGAGALAFDGSADYVACPRSLTADLSGAAGRTVCVWADMDSDGWGAHSLFGFGSDEDCGEFGLRTETLGRMQLQLSGVCNVELAVGGIADGLWHHYCLAYDGATVSFSVDGSRKYAGALALNTSRVHPLYMGDREAHATSTFGFKGKLDEVVVYAGALDDAAVASLYGLAPLRPTARPTTARPSLAPTPEVQCDPGFVPSAGDCFSDATYDTSRYITRSAGASCYALVWDRRKWTAAEQVCAEFFHGHLACLWDQAEADAVALFRGSYAPWIGLNHRGNRFALDWSDRACCSSYRDWDEDGSKKTQAGWRHKEPKEDVVGTRYRCVSFEFTATKGRMVTDDCAEEKLFVCEAPPSRDATTCAACPTGTFGAAGARTCTTCPFGEYAAHAGRSRCTTCPAWSPARILSRLFVGDDDVASDSVQCGGSLGAEQRTAYLATAVLGGPVALLLGLGTAYGSYCLSTAMASVDVALGWARSAAGRDIHATVGGLGVFVFVALFTPFVCVFLQPIRQLNQWPYKGRLKPTNLKNGCDPGRVAFVFACGLTMLLSAAVFFLFAVPWFNVLRWRVVWNLVKGAVQARVDERARKKLRVLLVKGRRLLEHEEAHRVDLLATALADSAVCTACRDDRATAMNHPCAHRFFCAACAGDFRAANGKICPACREPSRLVEPNKKYFEANYSLRGLDGKPMTADGIKQAPKRALELLIEKTQRARDQAAAAFKADKCCAVCATVADLVISMPCGHATVCAACAADETVLSPDDDRRNHCLRCGNKAQLTTPVREMTCAVCFDSVDADYLVALGPCGHQLCTGCSVGYVRSALGDVKEHVRTKGFRCPLHVLGCESAIPLDVVERLIDRPTAPPDDEVGTTTTEEPPLAIEEFDRLARFFDEAAVPMRERFFCAYPDCARMFAVHDRDALIRWGAGAPPTRKKNRGPMAMLMRTNLRRGSAVVVGAASSASRSAAVAPAGALAVPTNHQQKNDPTPSPRQRTSLGRSGRPPSLNKASRTGGGTTLAMGGAAAAATVGEIDGAPLTAKDFDDRLKYEKVCPFTVCPHCKRGSCVRCSTPMHKNLPCGASKEETLTTMFVTATSKACPQCNLRITHSHGHACHHIKPGTGCPNCGTHFCFKCLQRGKSGNSCGCLLFCKNDQVENFVGTDPYPNDTRCGCTFCSQCALGEPCEQCDGNCAVCRGVVPPGPQSADQPWRAPTPTDPLKLAAFLANLAPGLLPGLAEEQQATEEHTADPAQQTVDHVAPEVVDNV